MAIFPNLLVEPVTQTNDRLRLDASRSFATQNESAITSILIEPNTGDGFIDVSEEKYLDWEYAASGDKIITTRVVAGSASADIESTLLVVTPVSDKLFSTDSDLVTHEADIMRWVKDGRNSHNDTHRRAQTIILKWLDKEGYVDINAIPFTKDAVIDIEEVRQWSIYIVLRLIFESISNAVDDVFSAKAKYYKGLEVDWRNRAALRLDVDGDGVVDQGEEIDPKFGVVVRR